jgi:2-polyprenyl-6-methoxyphenol hydroxylase-like FAD-dependent oxidoreductase
VTDHAVVIAGGGPTGLMLAGELALAGIDVVIVERRASQDVDGSRAGGLHSRTIEVLDQRGIAERFLAAGQEHPNLGYATIPLDISEFPTRHNYVLALWQSQFERILADWVLGELGVPILRGREVVGFAQDDSGVDVELSGSVSGAGPAGDALLRAEYLAGCDGGRSLIRKAAGIEFPGWDPTTSNLIAEVEMAEEPEWGLRRDALGIHSLSRMGDGGPVRRCDILSRTHKGGSGWAATCWVSRRSTRRRSRSLAARARTWGSFRGSRASACRLAFA